MDKNKLKSLLIPPDITIKQAMQKLDETAQKILFVVDDCECLRGTITDGDIRRGIISGLHFGDKIENVICRKFISISSDNLEIKGLARQIMIEKKIEQIPIINDEGLIIDVISWTDVIDEKSGLRQLHPNQVVIMAGGKGTRLDPFTKILPKPLIPIGNKPIIEIIMERYYQNGFHDFIYTLNYRKEYIKLFLKEHNFPYKVSWVEEFEYLGTAGGLSLLGDSVTQTFFVTNCDSLLEVDFEKVLEWHKANKAAITIIGCHNEVRIPFGVLEISGGKLKRIKEKPVHDILINTGAYVMEPHVISYIPQKQKMDMNQLIELVSQKEKVSVYPIYSGWFDMGQWDEYKKSVETIARIEGV
ncbi:MAG: sugar phosphate nucleotidyltransferase [Nitrospirota bacterium]